MQRVIRVRLLIRQRLVAYFLKITGKIEESLTGRFITEVGLEPTTLQLTVAREPFTADCCGCIPSASKEGFGELEGTGIASSSLLFLTKVPGIFPGTFARSHTRRALLVYIRFPA